MSLNETPLSERSHIAFFGIRNAGKSSLINAVTGQNISIVSDVKGTTTDPVYKSMELLPAGPVVFIDTPGLDDEGNLGQERIKRTYEILNKTNLAVVVIDSSKGVTKHDNGIILELNRKNIPFILAFNKWEQKDQDCIADSNDFLQKNDFPEERKINVSAQTGLNINQLKERIAALLIQQQESQEKTPLVSDLVKPGSYVILVVPIDKAAPKGRLILPQQQVIRDLLDNGSIPVVTKDTELEAVLKKTKSFVSLVITDSQVFKKVAALVPEEIPLTSFSILFSRYKGDLNRQLRNVSVLDKLNDGDTVLIAEGCTHHRQCGDIGTQKIPLMIKQHCGKDIQFEFTSGISFPKNLSKYRCVIHCGGCMLNEMEMKSRISSCVLQNVPVTNYGMVLAKTSGILERSIKPLEQSL